MDFRQIIFGSFGLHSTVKWLLISVKKYRKLFFLKRKILNFKMVGQILCWTQFGGGIQGTISALYSELVHRSCRSYLSGWVSGIGKKRSTFLWVRVTMRFQGSGCGSVGRAVAFNTSDPRFDSRHRQKFILNICLLSSLISTVLKRWK